MARTQTDLSPELIREIMSYFDTAAPSLSKSRLQPDVDLTASPTIDLKSISCISWKWRLIVLRTLFKHVRIILKQDGVSGWTLQVEAMLRFLRKSEIASGVESFTMVFTTREDGRSLPNKRLPSDCVDNLFRSAFKTIDPSCLTVVAPPDTLCLLTSCSLHRPVFDHYHMPHHILSLTRSSFTDGPYTPEPKPSIFSIRPWSRILLNEGSFIRAYSICGFPFTDTDPPSILQDLVSINSRTNKFVLPFQVREFSYIAIFPFSFHFRLLGNLLSRLRKLNIQLIPRSDITPDPGQTAQAQILDMMQERDSCYECLMQWILNPETAPSHRYLCEVECRDGDIDPAWALHMERYIEAIRTSKISLK